MKTTVFHGQQMRVKEYDAFDNVIAVQVPTLSAYAIEYGDFTPPIGVDIGFRVLSYGPDFKVDGDELTFSSGFSLKFGAIESCRLMIHYHGIRNYELLFPRVTDLALRARLAQFYEEAEQAFENGSWLAFALMAAAVYEGLLGWKLNFEADTFAKLIASARDKAVIDGTEAKILNVAREHRNLVHASKFKVPWVQRADAMDMRTTMDGLIRKLAQK